MVVVWNGVFGAICGYYFAHQEQNRTEQIDIGEVTHLELNAN